MEHLLLTQSSGKAQQKADAQGALFGEMVGLETHPSQQPAWKLALNLTTFCQDNVQLSAPGNKDLSLASGGSVDFEVTAPVPWPGHSVHLSPAPSPFSAGWPGTRSATPLWLGQ